MAFRFRGPEAPAHPAAPSGSPLPGEQAPGSRREHHEGQASAGLLYVLERVLRDRQPYILEQGVLCGQTAVHLAERGARVFLDEFEPPPPQPAVAPGGTAAAAPPPMRIDHPDGAFDLVLAWEMPDFVPPERLAEYAAELRRVLKAGGFVLLFAHGKPERYREPPPRYRVLPDDRVVRESSDRPAAQRWVHATRDLERSFGGFSIQKTHLQRNQMREVVALRGKS